MDKMLSFILALCIRRCGAPVSHGGIGSTSCLSLGQDLSDVESRWGSTNPIWPRREELPELDFAPSDQKGEQLIAYMLSEHADMGPPQHRDGDLPTDEELSYHVFRLDQLEVNDIYSVGGDKKSYQLQKWLSHGGFSSVFSGKDLTKSDGPEVAIKMSWNHAAQLPMEYFRLRVLKGLGVVPDAYYAGRFGIDGTMLVMQKMQKETLLDIAENMYMESHTALITFRVLWKKLNIMNDSPYFSFYADAKMGNVLLKNKWDIDDKTPQWIEDNLRFSDLGPPTMFTRAFASPAMASFFDGRHTLTGCQWPLMVEMFRLFGFSRHGDIKDSINAWISDREEVALRRDDFASGNHRKVMDMTRVDNDFYLDMREQEEINYDSELGTMLDIFSTLHGELVNEYKTGKPSANQYEKVLGYLANELGPERDTSAAEEP